MESDDPLVTWRVNCDQCGAPLALSDHEPTQIYIYTREGTKVKRHLKKSCTNSHCRKTFAFGYLVFKNKKVFQQITSETKYLLSSAETGFSIPYLYETTLLLLNVNANFGGLTETYNMLHCFKECSDKRNYLCEKRLASGFFLFSLLEMCSRRGVNPEFTTKENFIDDGIL